MDDRDHIRKLSDLVHDTVRDRVNDDRAQAERLRWMRFGDDDAIKRGDGITLDQLELGGLAHWLAGRYFNPNSMLRRLSMLHTPSRPSTFCPSSRGATGPPMEAAT